MSNGPYLVVNGHRVERLPRTDSHTYICAGCGGHADALDDYRAHGCDVAGGIEA